MINRKNRKCEVNQPVISNSAQYDFFPLAASSADMMVYNRRGSGGSYFSFGIPVNLGGEKRGIVGFLLVGPTWYK